MPDDNQPSEIPASTPADLGDTHHCTLSHGPMIVGDEIRWKPESSGYKYPPVPFPSKRVFAIAGEMTLRELVRRHHERLLKTTVGHLFPSNPKRFAAGVEKTADFIIEATGGPPLFTSKFGHTCMRTRHFPFTIDEQAREIWLAQLLLTLTEVSFPEQVVEEYWNWVESLSIRVINRRTMREDPKRYPLSKAHETLSFFYLNAND